VERRIGRDCNGVAAAQVLQGRLNQWAHWARVQAPGFFFLFEGPPTGCGEMYFLKLIILLVPLTKPSSG